MLKTNGEDETPAYNPVELLTCMCRIVAQSHFYLCSNTFFYVNLNSILVILDGYDKFCSTAKKLSSLLFELQRDHLQQFLLTWTILNKRMYQRYVYMEIQELIPECILKLKDLLEPEEYSTMAHRLIRFDEDMTSITKSWSDVWALLQDYHMGSEDAERRNRISCIQDLLKAIRDCEFDFSPYEKLLQRENSAKMQWMKMENRDEAWVLTVDYLKRVWQEKDDSRLYTSVRNERCITCDFALASHYAYVLASAGWLKLKIVVITMSNCFCFFARVAIVIVWPVCLPAVLVQIKGNLRNTTARSVHFMRNSTATIWITLRKT